MSSSSAFETWKKNLIRTYGKDAVATRGWLEEQWQAHLKKQGDVSLPADGSTDPLSLIRTDLGDCKRCGLCSTRTNIVFGEGNPKAELFFIGEGPGETEDLQGRPFVGRAGQLLEKIIEAMGLSRSQVYIANVVKCRPPANRVPEPSEVSSCSPFLFRQIEAVQPKILIVLGATALKALLGADTKISNMRGQFTEFRGIRMMPTFHPAYLLRNPPAKKDVWEDMKKVMAELGLEPKKGVTQ